MNARTMLASSMLRPTSTPALAAVPSLLSTTSSWLSRSTASGPLSQQLADSACAPRAAPNTAPPSRTVFTAPVCSLSSSPPVRLTQAATALGRSGHHATWLAAPTRAAKTASTTSTHALPRTMHATAHSTPYAPAPPSSSRTPSSSSFSSTAALDPSPSAANPGERTHPQASSPTSSPASAPSPSSSSESSTQADRSSSSSDDASARWAAAARAARAAPPRLYAGHTRLRPWERGAVAVGAAVGALLSPARADLVATLGETTGSAALESMRARMRASPTGREILEQRPRVTDATLARARQCAPGTFGAAYAAFMDERGFVAGERPATRFVDDEELAYVVQRARETHDFWHVLFDCHTNVFGELALKALEFVQTGLPMTALSVLGAQFRLSAADRALLVGTFVPWAVRAGARSVDLMTVYYERHLDDDLDDLRARWRIMTAPPAAQNRMRRRKPRA